MADVRAMGSLKREIGLAGATMMGLGSMVGTGVFVSIGVAAGAAGPAVLLAIALAAVVATCNALSSAQLAAARPVSGGTYEYGYAYLTPSLGFSAGWMFLCAKSASAATAALGFAGYLLRAAGVEGLVVPVALAAVALLTLIVLNGIRASNRANAAIVSVTVLSLALFVVAGLISLQPDWPKHWTPFFPSASQSETGALGGLLQATALMFVAFTGYARIATLGEEVHEPRHTIPRAIIATLIISAVLYFSVGAVAISTIGSERLAAAAQTEVAPLQVAAATFGISGAAAVITAGALTAMLSVLLNLILGLSRMLLAMGRRGDMPGRLAVIDPSGSPSAAISIVGLGIAALTLLGDVKLTWSFSAFTVLIYYAITNLAALRLASEQRMYSPLFAWAGLASCLFLAFWVDWEVWLSGLALLAVGLVWHALARRIAGSASPSNKGGTQ
jgi:APA family basic amino acid/polyamine antiporter